MRDTRSRITAGLRWFTPAIAAHLGTLSIILAASIAVQLLALVAPFTFQAVIDRVLISDGLSTLNALFVVLILTAAVSALINGLRSYLLAYTTYQMTANLSSRLYAHLLCLPMAFFDRWAIGKLTSRTKEVDEIKDFLVRDGLRSIIDIMFIVFFPLVLLVLSPTLAAIVLIAIPFQVLIYVILGPFLRKREHRRFLSKAQHQARLVETLANAETVKAAAIEPQVKEALESDLARALIDGLRVKKIAIVGTQLTDVAGRITEAAIIFFGVRLIIAGDMTLGELVAFHMISGYVSRPLTRLSELWEQWQATRVAFVRLGDILNESTEGAVRDAEQGRPTIANGRLTFDAVSFRYGPKSPLVLDRVTFAIEPRARIGIMGPSGSGKSTLIKLVARFHDPTAGHITIDGHDAASIDRRWLRSHLAYVPQDVAIFSSSVAVNIALGKPNASDHDIKEAAHLADAHSFIEKLADGYETVVGERGVQLSGGQRQRLALARALIADPIVLLLDEATSALDAETEHRILSRLVEQHIGTLILVSHRPALRGYIDRLLLVKDGQLSEEVPSATLMTKTS